MKRLLTFLLLLLLSFALCACNPGEVVPESSEPTTDASSAPLDPSCQHAFADATCTQPKFCKYCGGTDGDPAPHSWKGPFCNLPVHCGVCGVHQSEELGDHEWEDANCVRGKRCIYCGKEEGEPNGVHRWSYSECTKTQVCMLCAAVEGTPSGEHEWQPANCASPKICRVCLATEGKPNREHNWIEANCGYPKTCRYCQDTEGTPVGEHKWAGASCGKPKTCSVCSMTEGEPTGIHDYLAANCMNPATCKVCGNTTGAPNGEHVWHEADCAPKRCEVCLLRVGESAGLPHTWVGGSCYQKQYCSECQAIGDIKHDYNEKYKCKVCKYYEFSYGLTYKLNGNEYTVTGMGSCTDLHVKIPETHNGKPVTAIAKRAFFENGPWEVTIPKTIKHIGLQAFFDASRINYESTIEDWINVKKDSAMTKNYTGFYKPYFLCGSYRLYIQGELVETLVIPESITEIPAGALACIEIKKIVFHDKITKIGESAFAEIGYLVTDTSSDPNTWFVDLKIPSSVKEIGDFAFHYPKVDKIVIPESVTKIGVDAFDPILTIYCESSGKPAGWDDEWMGFYEPGYFRNIYWKGQWEYINGVPTPKQ